MAQEKTRNIHSALDFDEIKKLIELLEKSSLEELEISHKEIHLRLKKPSPVHSVVSQNSSPILPSPIQTVVPSLPKTLAETAAQDSSNESKLVPPSTSLFEVKSPMVGTFYRAPAPNAEPFVKIGDLAKKGQTLCIIEAMKIMNEIESEVEGKIVEIKVQNAEPVEYGEVIMVIDTAAV